MAVTSVIACPKCEKKFKGREDLQGKKIRCPGCGHPFIVEKVATDKPDSAREPAPKAPAPRPAAASPAPAAAPLLDEDGNPYGVHTLDLSPRCPNCANELLSANALICHHCGYNTQTRTLAKTRKVIEHTFQDRLLWLLPSLGCALGMLFLYMGTLFYCFELPSMLDKNSWVSMFDSEAMRLWIAMLMCGGIWGLGVYAHKWLIFMPTPPEKLKD